MKLDFRDPAILISLGIILVGSALLIWAIGKLFKKSPPPDALFPEEDLTPNNEPLYTDAPISSEADLPPLREEPRPAASQRPPDPPASAPVAGREMISRLETMSQRLNDMQTVLQRQATAPASGAPLTPETIDKLLKIISNVTQQVDLLQRSLGAPQTPAAGMPPLGSAGPKPAATPSSPPATPPPSAKPGPSVAAPTPGGKSIGIAGGALSSLPRQSPPAAPGTPNAPNPPPANPPPGR